MEISIGLDGVGRLGWGAYSLRRSAIVSVKAIESFGSGMMGEEGWVLPAASELERSVK